MQKITNHEKKQITGGNFFVLAVIGLCIGAITSVIRLCMNSYASSKIRSQLDEQNNVATENVPCKITKFSI